MHARGQYYMLLLRQECTTRDLVKTGNIQQETYMHVSTKTKYYNCAVPENKMACVDQILSHMGE